MKPLQTGRKVKVGKDRMGRAGCPFFLKLHPGFAAAVGRLDWDCVRLPESPNADQ